MKKKLLLFLLCICILFSACSNPPTGNDDTDTLQNTNTHEISDSVSRSDSDTFPDTSFHSADTDYPGRPDDPMFEKEFSKDLIKKIKEDALSFFIKSDEFSNIKYITLQKYIGTYQDGCIAMFIDYPRGEATIGYEQYIADILFTFSTQQKIYIYHDSQFTELKEAYETGIISKEDVHDIHNKYQIKN